MPEKKSDDTADHSRKGDAGPGVLMHVFVRGF